MNVSITLKVLCTFHSHVVNLEWTACGKIEMKF